MYTLPIIVGVCIVMSFALPVLASVIIGEVKNDNSRIIYSNSQGVAFKWTCIAVVIGLIGLACTSVPYTVMLTSTSYDYQLWVIILSAGYFAFWASFFCDD